MADFPKEYDFAAIEEEITEFWDRNRIAEKTITLEEGRPLFSFLEGPPTANAPPGLHHVQSRLYKDLVCRFHYMKGFSVPRKGGWDCHGLPVEVQVEKKLGLATKKQVVEYGIEKFNKLCRQDVFAFIKDWNALTKKMAFWIDLEHPYITLENYYIESVWWSLKQLYNKGLLFESHKVVPYCPRCETPLSSHEVALGYQDVTEETIVTKFRLKGDDKYLLAWTTTPWTTPSNLGLAVGKDIIYAVVEENGTRYVLAKGAVERYFKNPVILEEMNGEQLVGKEYIPLFDYFVGKLDLPAWKIIEADFVNTDEGTGIVHQAPAFGEEDYDAMKKAGMAFVQPVDESGRFTKEVPDFEGKFVKDADQEIVAMLEKDGALFRKENYTHSYPFCWRCTTPLIYYALKSWFVKVTEYREQLLANNDMISWYPEHIKDGRFGDWLKNVKDWALSRNKFWGTPLPIWKCESCGQETAIGSREELEEAAINKKEAKGIDLHKPAIDKVKIECSCGKEMERLPYVIDTWYDSGAASFAQLHYPFENKELFEKMFPYSFITEGIDQTRGWFYTLHALGTMLFGKNAYKSVVVSGLVIDEKGEKMSKSKGNVLKPEEVFSKIGVDAVRMQLCSSAPWSSKRFGYELVAENVTPFITTLWNSCVFASSVIAPGNDETSGLQVEDKWIISKASSLIKKVSSELEAHNYHRCAEEIKSFVIDDLSRWYIRLVRGRNDDAAADTLRQVLGILAKLLAPFTPYLAEYVYLNLAKENAKSVHLAAWPEPEFIDEQLEEKMNCARGIVQAALSAREKIQRGLKWPVKEITIASAKESVRAAAGELKQLIAEQANAKKIAVEAEFTGEITRLKADYAKMGPVHGEATPAIIAQLSYVSQKLLLSKLEQTGEFEAEVDGKKYALKKEQFIISKEVPENYETAEFAGGTVYVNKEMTPEMEAEGLARELARKVQQARKEAGMKKSEKISIHVKLEMAFAEKIKSQINEIKEKTGAARIVLSDSMPQEDYANKTVTTIKGSKIELFFNKVQNG